MKPQRSAEASAHEESVGKPFSIHDLPTIVQRVLEDCGCSEQQSGRVSVFPNVRTIRMYVTSGLLSPCDLDGRNGRYDLGHVLQIAFVKKKQSEGKSVDDLKKLGIASMSNTALLHELGLSTKYQPTMNRAKNEKVPHAKSEPIEVRSARIRNGLVITIQGISPTKDIEERVRAAVLKAVKAKA